MDLFWLLWMLVLPILGLVTPIIFLVFWKFIVPAVARMLTWSRFRNVTIHAVADASGFVELVPTKEQLPEGIVRTKRGWHFLPRPISQNPKTDEEKMAERIGLKTHILQSVGKPFLLGYAGKITSMNFATLAGMQQNEESVNLKGYISDMETIIKDMPKHFKKELTLKLKVLKQAMKAEPTTLINPDAIKEIVQKMYPPSMIDALAENRLLKGRKQAGRQYTSLILGGAIIIGLVVLGIAVIMFLK